MTMTPTLRTASRQRTHNRLLHLFRNILNRNAPAKAICGHQVSGVTPLPAQQSSALRLATIGFPGRGRNHHSPDIFGLPATGATPAADTAITMGIGASTS